VGSIPGGAVGNFHLRITSCSSMALNSIQNITKMITVDISWGEGWGVWSKGGGCVGLTNLPPSCDGCLEFWEPQPPVAQIVSPGLYSDRDFVENWAVDRS